jgi:hypothetical protein
MIILKNSGKFQILTFLIYQCFVQGFYLDSGVAASAEFVYVNPPQVMKLWQFRG